MPASEVWSLLLGIIESRATARGAKDLQDQWSRDRFVQPAFVDPRTSLGIDQHLFARFCLMDQNRQVLRYPALEIDSGIGLSSRSIPDHVIRQTEPSAEAFQPIELSPLAPLGVCSSMAPASQNKIVSTTRGTEVVSDPTNVMALESARRLRSDPAMHVRLASSHRCTRAQPIPNRPGHSAHFRLFCLTSAGHERPSRDFMATELALHINTHLAALSRLERHGYAFGQRKVRILRHAENQQVVQRITAAIQSIPVEHQPLEHAYYDGIRFQIDVQAPDGSVMALIDGGAFDWLGKLLSNNKMTFIASAMGSQIVAHMFRQE
jgi:hypothetical protein